MKTDCIEWTGYRQPIGYGAKRFRGKVMLAHRVAWIKANGEIPEGMCVLHRCDNRGCVNPEHLFLGTQIDNIQDCYDKGRISRVSRNRGTSQGGSKITEQTAIRIKMLHGVIPAAEVARWLNLSTQGVWDIMVGRTWKHVTAQTRYSI